MRTTINIDDDVLAAVSERARREKSTAGKVLSDLARRALTAGSNSGDEEFLGFHPLPSRGVVVTNELINSVREQVGDE